MLIAESFRIAVGGRKHQQARGFDGVPRDHDSLRTLPVKGSVVQVLDAGHLSLPVVHQDPGDMAVGTNFGSVGKGVRDMG